MIRFGHIPVLLVRASFDSVILTSRYGHLSGFVSHPPVSRLASVVSIPTFELIRLVQHLAGFRAACLTSDETLERFSGITTRSQRVAPTVTIRAPSTCVQFVPNLKKASSRCSPLDSICRSPFVSSPLSRASLLTVPKVERGHWFGAYVLRGLERHLVAANKRVPRFPALHLSITSSRYSLFFF